MNSSDDLPVVSFQLPDIPGGINTTGFGITIRSDILPFDRNYSIAIEGENSAGRAFSPKFRLSEYCFVRCHSIMYSQLYLATYSHPVEYVLNIS